MKQKSNWPPKLFFLGFSLIGLVFLPFLSDGQQKKNINTKKNIYKAEVIIYGGTSAAIAAAVELLTRRKYTENN
jgi:hypothetical protein